jgi:hypothetical protein
LPTIFLPRLLNAPERIWSLKSLKPDSIPWIAGEARAVYGTHALKKMIILAPPPLTPLIGITPGNWHHENETSPQEVWNIWIAVTKEPPAEGEKTVFLAGAILPPAARHCLITTLEKASPLVWLLGLGDFARNFDEKARLGKKTQ